MIKEDPSIKISLIQERINSEFFYMVSYRKAWMAKQKAIAIEYGDWEESYAKLSSWLNTCKITLLDPIFKYYMMILLLATGWVVNNVSLIKYFGLSVNVNRLLIIVSQSYKLTAHIYTGNTVGPY